MSDFKHKDKFLNALRWLAMGAMGLYVYQAQKRDPIFAKEKQLGVSIDSDKLIDSAMGLVEMPNIHKPLVSMAIKEFVNGFKKGKKNARNSISSKVS